MKSLEKAVSFKPNGNRCSPQKLLILLLFYLTWIPSQLCNTDIWNNSLIHFLYSKVLIFPCSTVSHFHCVGGLERSVRRTNKTGPKSILCFNLGNVTGHNDSISHLQGDNAKLSIAMHADLSKSNLSLQNLWTNTTFLQARKWLVLAQMSSSPLSPSWLLKNGNWEGRAENRTD